MSLYPAHHLTAAAMMSANYGLLAFDPMRSFLARNLNSQSASGNFPSSSFFQNYSPPSSTSPAPTSIESSAAELAMHSPTCPIHNRVHMTSDRPTLFDTAARNLCFAYQNCQFVSPAEQQQPATGIEPPTRSIIGESDSSHQQPQSQLGHLGINSLESSVFPANYSPGNSFISSTSSRSHISQIESPVLMNMVNIGIKRMICGPKNYSLGHHRSMNGNGANNGTNGSSNNNGGTNGTNGESSSPPPSHGNGNNNNNSSNNNNPTNGSNGNSSAIVSVTNGSPNGTNSQLMAEIAMHKMMQHQQQQQQQQQQQHNLHHLDGPPELPPPSHHIGAIGPPPQLGSPHGGPSMHHMGHLGSGPNGPNGSIGGGSDKDYLCEVCGKRFTQKGNLKTHIRSVHTKEKPFSCPVCGKSFSQKGNMQTHVRTHNKDDRFPCNLCGKTFSQKGNLKTHMQRHAGTLPPSKRTGPGAHRRSSANSARSNGSNGSGSSGGGGGHSLGGMYGGPGGPLDLGSGDPSSPSHRSSSTDDEGSSSPLSDLSLVPPSLIASPHHHSSHLLHQRAGLIGSMGGPVGGLHSNGLHSQSGQRSPLGSPGPEAHSSPMTFSPSPSVAARALYSSPSPMTGPLAAHSANWLSASSGPTNLSQKAAAAAAAAAVAHQHQVRSANPYDPFLASHPYNFAAANPLSRLSLFSGMHPLGPIMNGASVPVSSCPLSLGSNGTSDSIITTNGNSVTSNGTSNGNTNTNNNADNDHENEQEDNSGRASSRSNKSDNNSPTALVSRPHDSKW